VNDRRVLGESLRCSDIYCDVVEYFCEQPSALLSKASRSMINGNVISVIMGAVLCVYMRLHLDQAYAPLFTPR